MTKPVAFVKGRAIAFPDVCYTPVGTSMVRIPYVNVARLEDASGISAEPGKELIIGSAEYHVLLLDSEIATSTGDEAGSGGGVNNGGEIKGKCKMVQASKRVLYGPEGKGLVRFLDRTDQNIGSNGKANTQGVVLSSFPRIMVGD